LAHETRKANDWKTCHICKVYSSWEKVNNRFTASEVLDF